MDLANFEFTGSSFESDSISEVLNVQRESDRATAVSKDIIYLSDSDD